MEDFELWDGVTKTLKSLSTEIDCLETMISEHHIGSKTKLKKLRSIRQALVDQCNAIGDKITAGPPVESPVGKLAGTFWDRLQRRRK
jgi:hypothetical protein